MFPTVPSTTTPPETPPQSPSAARKTTYPASTGRNFDEILRVIDSQLTAQHKLATPVNWQPGEDCIIVPAVGDDEAATMFPEGWVTIRPHLRLVPQPEPSL